MRYLILLSLTCIVFVLVITRCSKNDSTNTNLSSGILMNWSKFDGCGWVIELDNHDHTILEPNNLGQFPITLTDSLPVNFTYEIAPNQSSSCMAGTVVKIIDITSNKR